MQQTCSVLYFFRQFKLLLSPHYNVSDNVQTLMHASLLNLQVSASSIGKLKFWETRAQKHLAGSSSCWATGLVLPIETCVHLKNVTRKNVVGLNGQGEVSIEFGQMFPLSIHFWLS